MTREPGPVKGGSTVIAFVEDPTGYKWELIERKGAAIPEPIAQVMLRVTDLDAAVAYYENCLGMQLIRKRENKEYEVRQREREWGGGLVFVCFSCGVGVIPHLSPFLSPPPPSLPFSTHSPSWATAPRRRTPCLS